MAKTMANTRFSDIVLDDASLSMAAKGIFVTMGYLGNGRTLQDLGKLCNETLSDLERAAQELIEAGYIVTEGDGELHIKAAPSFGILG